MICFYINHTHTLLPPNSYINLAWNEDYVRGQDYFTCLQFISYNQVGQSLVWNYVRENWLKIVDRFGLSDRYLGRLISGITFRFATNTQLEEMQAFFTKYPEAGAGAASRKEALATVRNNVKWLEKNLQSVGRWLENVATLTRRTQSLEKDVLRTDNVTNIISTTMSSQTDSNLTTNRPNVTATTPETK